MLAWYKADGGLKEMSCRVAMLRMHEHGLICLPSPRRTKPPLRKCCPTSATDPQTPIQEPVHQLGELQLRYFVTLDDHVLALLGFGAAAWQDDWFKRYNIRPVLMETFIETERFAGTSYRASNWITIGKTQGRGKLGPAGKQSVPIKDVLLYPLASDFRRALTS